MAVTWTHEQQQVISLRRRSLLVSAAAGSGKTAVLVERILSKVMEKENPLDLDRLLVMTFTRAAAGEMKERLLRSLEDALLDDPNNEHLRRQTNLVHVAQISTIDGFCTWLLKSYFHQIGLDPSFRVAEEGELTILREEVLADLLEEAYEEGSEEFLHLVECYSSGKNDDPLKEILFKLHNQAQSNPYPERWLTESLGAFSIETRKELEESSLFAGLKEMAREALLTCRRLALQALELCEDPEGPALYAPTLQEDLSLMEAPLEALEREGFSAAVKAAAQAPDFGRLTTKSQKEASELLKSQVKALRDTYKKLFKEEVAGLYLAGGEEEILEDLGQCGRCARELVRLALAFEERFAAAKREKNILDFGDMEHLALAILIGEDGEPTQAARELSLRFDEVLVDEYQDSNLVQEAIAQAVSGWAKGEKNLFMVGDVKQSIYRFRQAKPELFMEKYGRFRTEDSEEQRIDLHKNFRSRAGVLSSCNYLFRQLMGADLGGVPYTEEAFLYYGANYPPYSEEDEGEEEKREENKREENLEKTEEEKGEEKKEDGKAEDPVTELLLLHAEDEEAEILGEEKEGDEEMPESKAERVKRNARELEALMVAKRISELVGSQPVFDRETGAYRPARYGDIVILLRSMTGWAETFSKVLGEQGILTYTNSRSGYFSAPEVVTVLQFLALVDNPRQDIPLAGVLRSPLVGLTSQEMGLLRLVNKEGLYYDCLRELAGEKGEEILKGLLPLEEKSGEGRRLLERCRAFFAVLEDFRDRAVYTPVHELISQMLSATGFGEIAAAMPGGEQRRANLQMLVQKALDYEATSTRSLFGFLRTMEHLQKYEVDFGEVNVSAEGERVVQVMTVHHSKGLEFPIVFVCGLGKRVNFQDLNDPVLTHPEMGLGLNRVDPAERTERPGITRTLIKRKLKEETLGEELRVLYVALTRAKEKLILTGYVPRLSKKLESLSLLSRHTEWLLPYREREKAASLLDYVLLAMARHKAMGEVYGEFGMTPERREPYWGGEAAFLVKTFVPTDLAAPEVEKQVGRDAFYQALRNFDGGEVWDEDIRKTLTERFSFVYPCGYLRNLPVKVSVSELKKKSMQEGEEEPLSMDVFYEPDVIPLLPSFVQEKEEEGLRGAQRGTAYHRFLECLDYKALGEAEEELPEVKRQLEALVSERRMEKVQADCIDFSDILQFLHSPIGTRMARAGREGKLRREQPFVFCRPAKELSEEWPYEEQVLIQGIIDGFFFEGEEIVLVDYKTDRVAPGEGHVLADRYRVQLEDYALALERLTGRRVKERYLYSITLGEEVPV